MIDTEQDHNDINWLEDSGVIYFTDFTLPSDNSTVNIASFDLDSTLIKVKSGKKFPLNGDDWEWNYPEIPNKLRELYQEGWLLVIFSNQAGIRKGKVDKEQFKKKIETICSELNVEISFFASIEDNIYRKPCTGMWYSYLSFLNNVNILSSLFVGDAAGREKRRNYKRDFSCSDRKFAYNCNISFYTPEQFFLGHENERSWSWRSAVPQELLEKYNIEYQIPLINTQEMIILIGAPASGKSFIASYFTKLETYITINQDTLRTKRRCLTKCKTVLEEGKSVIIDRTNPQITDRKEFISMAKDFNIPVRAIYFDVDKEYAFHMNSYRAKVSEYYPDYFDKRKRLANVVIHTYFKRLQIPERWEGFTEITEYKPHLQFIEQLLPIFLQYN